VDFGDLKTEKVVHIRVDRDTAPRLFRDEHRVLPIALSRDGVDDGIVDAVEEPVHVAQLDPVQSRRAVVVGGLER
jgi:hypothetical protein